jgi:alpha-galactosidase
MLSAPPLSDGVIPVFRVSADAGPAWLPTFPMPDCKWNLPCGRNMVRNTINRMTMHGRWWVNDPDCMLLRESTYFTTAEVIGKETSACLILGGL